jgi:hypothetical protein
VDRGGVAAVWVVIPGSGELGSRSAVRVATGSADLGVTLENIGLEFLKCGVYCGVGHTGNEFPGVALGSGVTDCPFDLLSFGKTSSCREFLYVFKEYIEA